MNYLKILIFLLVIGGFKLDERKEVYYKEKKNGNLKEFLGLKFEMYNSADEKKKFNFVSRNLGNFKNLFEEKLEEIELENKIYLSKKFKYVKFRELLYNKIFRKEIYNLFFKDIKNYSGKLDKELKKLDEERKKLLYSKNEEKRIKLKENIRNILKKIDSPIEKNRDEKLKKLNSFVISNFIFDNLSWYQNYFFSYSLVFICLFLAYYSFREFLNLVG